jgi:hypothetical protein
MFLPAFVKAPERGEVPSEREKKKNETSEER